MASHWPKAAELVQDAEAEVLAYMAFPQEHWTRLYSTNPLERLNKEIKRRTTVVGIFPDVASVQRLVGAILLDVHDEWQVNKRYFSQESMRTLLGAEAPLRLVAALHVEPIH
jgi:putative transposase